MASALHRPWRGLVTANAPGRTARTPELRHTGLPPGPRLPKPLQTLLFWGVPLGYLEWCRARYGDRFTLLAVDHPPLVFLSDPDDIRAVFGAPAEVLAPGEGGSSILPIVGERSFMLLDGEEHLVGRRAILPRYRGAAVMRHLPLLNELAAREVASWPREEPIALHPRLRALALAIVLRTIFSSAPEERLELLCNRLLAMLSITAGPLLSLPALRRGPGRWEWNRFIEHRREADRLIHELVRERAGGDGDDIDSEDILSSLLAARGLDGAPLSSRELRDNVMSIVLAGHETTASELAWAFTLLAHHPLVQERLIEELDSGTGEEYLMATIQETLRHRPVFLFTIPRAVREPIQIGGFTYEPPAQLLGCIYLMHHDPLRYRDPEQFRPERFLPGAMAEALPQAPGWIPWGGGRKRCPGLHMATLEMQVLLRTVLSQATLSPVKRRVERARWRSVVVTPYNGARVVLHSR
jgi:cytochrome P450